jgi:hypothetical protein
MFTVYIDDSGTAPEHPVAIASGVVVPARQVTALEREWDSFLQREGFRCFHTSVCVARNQRSDFAGWDEAKVSRVLARVRQFIRRYSTVGFSISIDKAVYDAVIPDELRRAIGRYHYTWAVDAVCGFIHAWAKDHQVPMEYVFDNIDKSQKAQKREIETVMEHGELMHPGSFLGHYSFRNRCDIPALQCADLFAWTCYQRSLFLIRGKPLNPLAEECWRQISKWNNDAWCQAWIASREQMEDWVRRVYADPNEMRKIRGS